MQFDSKQFQHYMKHEHIAESIDHLAKQINKDYSMEDQLLLVGVLKGAIITIADLVRKLHSVVDVDFVRTAAYGKTLSSPGTVTFDRDISTDVRNKHVIIVEEIIDSGRALKFLYQRLQAAEPLSLKVASLLDKSKRRVVDVPVDYVGRKINNEFLIGYGMDLEEKCRNLPDIYSLKYPN